MLEGAGEVTLHRQVDQPRVGGAELLIAATQPLDGSRAALAMPTIAEQGVPGCEIEGWFAAIGPRNLPAKEVTRMNAAFAAALAEPRCGRR